MQLSLLDLLQYWHDHIANPPSLVQWAALGILLFALTLFASAIFSQLSKSPTDIEDTGTGSTDPYVEALSAHGGDE